MVCMEQATLTAGRELECTGRESTATTIGAEDEPKDDDPKGANHLGCSAFRDIPEDRAAILPTLRSMRGSRSAATTASHPKAAGGAGCELPHAELGQQSPCRRRRAAPWSPPPR